MHSYSVTYIPSLDPILPTPSTLHVRIKNTSAIPYRAAYLHGPYTLHVSAYRSTFNPNKQVHNPKEDGVPQFEPNLKAGGHWHSRLTVPEAIKETGVRHTVNDHGQDEAKSVTWIIEIASQVLFSNTAAVHFELLIGRDHRSLDVGFAAIASKGYGEPGKVYDVIQYELDGPGEHLAPKGVYSGAIRLRAEDTASLWNKPALPRWDGDASTKIGRSRRRRSRTTSGLQRRDTQPQPDRKPKKIHLVILTHGLHSNIGADMLYLKESIDATVNDARKESLARRDALRARRQQTEPETSTVSRDETTTASQPSDPETQPSEAHSKGPDKQSDDAQEDESDDEEVLVRGFPGNAVKTERGIQYLGKRLARYILTFTYPDQPVLPPAKSMTRSFSGFPSSKQKSGKHDEGSSKSGISGEKLPYTFSRISFIGHSLGGLVQTYAIAYIYKHSPEFFAQIQPENFVAMAAPLLGLSNENPMYVRFALDFGLVGRTGQDLGLTWSPPRMARSGWSAMIAGLGGNGSDQQPKQEDPRSKPLLRILPSGPAHRVLKMFRNRTVYSNVVNDGIVPLRTSCLLFLDWRGLGPVENARRDNGLIGTMAQFGWAELTGSNTTTSHKPKSVKTLVYNSGEDSEDERESIRRANSPKVIDPKPSDTIDPDLSRQASSPSPHQFLADPLSIEGEINERLARSPDRSALAGFMNLFRPNSPKSRGQPSLKGHRVSSKADKAYRRAQTIKKEASPASALSVPSSRVHDYQNSLSRPSATRGDSLIGGSSNSPPPKTSIFEAAGDILNPPIPPESWLTDPSSRSRTIFHDRIYHPTDIPSPPPKRSRLGRSFSSEGNLGSSNSKGIQRQDSTASTSSVDASGMRVEEKIARAYHHDLSWRKVLVRLEPDAHNNMIVRRMFANAYGWDVVKHLCDTHFGNTIAARTDDSLETNEERAKPAEEPVSKDGDEVQGQHDKPDEKPQVSPKHIQQHARTISELREASDQLPDLPSASSTGSLSRRTGSTSRHLSSIKDSPSQRDHDRQFSNADSIVWDDNIFFGNSESEDDGDASDHEEPGAFEAFQRFWSPSPKQGRRHSTQEAPPPSALSSSQDDGPAGQTKGTSDKDIDEFLGKPPAAHLSPRLPRSSEVDADAVEPLRRTRTDETIKGTSKVGGETRSISGAATTELGLGKSVEEQVGDASSPSPQAPGSAGGEKRESASESGKGLTETVANLSHHGENQG